MFGIILAVIGALCEEVSNSIGKYAFARHWEHPVMMGLLNNGWTIVYFAVISLVSPGGFVVIPETIPFLIALIILGSAQTIGTLLALRRASRSTFGLLRTLTIPALVLIDVFSGVAISPMKLIAVAIIYAGTVWLHRNHGIERRGAWIVLFVALNGAVTLSLLKHVFDMGTSVPAAQLVILVPGLAVLGAWALRVKHAKPAKGSATILSIQTAAYGGATLVESYALLFAPASIVVTALRSSAVLLAVISGNVLFHEHHVRDKLIASGIIMIGLALLAFG